MGSDVNPFATRFTRPGALEYLFAGGEGVEDVLGRLRTHLWWGQIVGPHGSGKSTLLASLVPALAAAGRHVVFVQLRQGEHRLPRLSNELETSVQIVIDGYEQLGWLERRRIKSRCRSAGCGLLVTTHRDLGLPTIFETRPSEQLAAEIVARLLPGGLGIVRQDDVSAAYSATGGNLREMLMRLYDVYEARTSRARQPQRA